MRSPAIEAVSRLATYNQLTFDAYERGIKRRGWAAAVEEREIGHHSFKDTLVHILNVHEVWMVAAPQNKWDIFDDPTRRKDHINSWKKLERYRDRVWAAMDRQVSGLTEAKLRRRVKVPWFNGRYTLEDAFYQSSFEQAHHIGEIIGA